MISQIEETCIQPKNGEFKSLESFGLLDTEDLRVYDVLDLRN